MAQWRRYDPDTDTISFWDMSADLGVIDSESAAPSGARPDVPAILSAPSETALLSDREGWPGADAPLPRPEAA
jgi:hypothetical protein